MERRRDVGPNGDGGRATIAVRRQRPRPSLAWVDLLGPLRGIGHLRQTVLLMDPFLFVASCLRKSVYPRWGASIMQMTYNVAH